jgi:BirA family biotin operon repressor/biotin-[acetyl-CoA-carboxylase] ligase
MRCRMFGEKIIHFPVLTSTNLYLKEHYRELTHGTAVTCDRQTAGRGRFNRTWYSGRDLALSVLIKEDLRVGEIFRLGLVTAAAVFETLRRLVPDVLIKWPNDIVADGKKVAGILLESIIGTNNLDCLIIGVGVNVNTTVFPPELEGKATSLRLLTGVDGDVEALRAAVLKNLDVFYKKFKDGNHRYADICAENSCLIGREVVFSDFSVSKSGRVLAILKNGNILIDINGVPIEYNSGEITLIN